LNKSDIKRQAILDTAYGLFRAHGFAKTSMAEVTARVGGSKATLYSYFPSKEELFAECMMAAVENYLSEAIQHLDVSGGSAQVALQNFGISVLQFICSRTGRSSSADHCGGGALGDGKALLRQDHCLADTGFGVLGRLHGVTHSPSR